MSSDAFDEVGWWRGVITLFKNPPPEGWFSKDIINRKIKIGRVSIRLCWRSKKKSFMGRFGGGWNWEFGFQLGSSTLILNLLIMSLSISIIRKKDGE